MTGTMIGLRPLRGAMRLRRALAWIGQVVRLRVRFALTLMSLSAGIVVEAFQPRSWRRSVRSEFWRVLHLALIGSLPATVFVAALIGLGMVYQALYWLRVAGQEGSVGAILVTILLREVAPVMVGVILLGRSGSVLLTELSQLQSGRQIQALQAQGIDPFRFLVLPRGVAFSLASYTLGIIFTLTALLAGFGIATLLGVAQASTWSFLDSVLLATTPRDFIIFPVKMLSIGLLVGATACLTGLSADPEDDGGKLIARGFVRGMLVVILTSGLFSLAG